MSRPSKCRLVANVPGVTYFKPEGIPLKCLEEVRISIEEIEALRLKEIEGFDQEVGAVMMQVSRPTFQRILASARRKITVALLQAKAIRIEGGHFEITPENGTSSQSVTGCPNYGRSACCQTCPKMANPPDAALNPESEKSRQLIGRASL